MTCQEAYLRSVLSKYRHVDLTKREILNVFQSFIDLRPNLDSFVFNDGTKKELLCLIGTIPVQYKGKPYNIPICVWLMDTHPYKPPMVFVKPTPTMQLKAGRHVDNTGRVYLPYLHEWKHPSSDLLGLVQILAIVLGEEPPVFSKPTAKGDAEMEQMLSNSWPPGWSNVVTPDAASTSLPINAVSNRDCSDEQKMEKAQQSRTPEYCNVVDLQGANADVAEASTPTTVENPNVVVAPQSPTQTLLLSVMAEEHAAEDELYNLGEQLRAGVIDIDLFLKQVRELFRKQSVLRVQFIDDRHGGQKS